MAINNLKMFIEGAIEAIANDRGVESYFNDAFVRTWINEKTTEEAWVTLTPVEKLYAIHDAFRKLSKKRILMPGKRSKGSTFYAKRPENEREIHRSKPKPRKNNGRDKDNSNVSIKDAGEGG